ncbi:MAG TPA: 50S ribosomal protein L11 [Methanothermococcus okinawensis]|uniref:Large ribosomal subunit protein uL11 n=1 Tax=Methanothermococcus okinawensis TaxID=155863 RepID=A0A832ZAB1_9EURY|nr:50S ribosomal protein L11 [Methanothermococcus okinawensis]HIP90759.1 50S ribosomal protein L11 [Methanothermococcus okinawensis]
MGTEVVEVLVTGGKATAGPPLGPAIGPLGINVMKVVNEINEKTKAYEGMSVPVKIIVNTEDKTFKIEVGIPPTSALIKKELNIEKGSSEPKHKIVGNLTMEQAVKIAKMKKDSMLSYTLKNATKEVVGTCVSMGVTVDGKDPKEVTKLIDKGEYDQYFKEDN